MKSESVVTISVNKKSNTIHIVSEFAASIQLVWEAWTKQDMLEKWWAPKPYHIETRSFDLREGGIWLYAMVGPKNEKHWSKVELEKIKPLKQLIWQDAFSDENGHIDLEKPRSQWTIDFSESKGITIVDITINPDSSAELEMLVEMGFKEGITMTLNYLGELLK